MAFNGERPDHKSLVNSAGDLNFVLKAQEAIVRFTQGGHLVDLCLQNLLRQLYSSHRKCSGAVLTVDMRDQQDEGSGSEDEETGMDLSGSLDAESITVDWMLWWVEEEEGKAPHYVVLSSPGVRTLKKMSCTGFLRFPY